MIGDPTTYEDQLGATRSGPRPIVVVGAGIIGLSTAYYLRRSGADVTVLERDRVGARAAASFGNAGWICPSLSGPLPSPGLFSQLVRSAAHKSNPLHISLGSGLAAGGWLWRFRQRCNKHDYEAGLHATANLAADAFDRYDELREDGVEFVMKQTGLLFAGLGTQSTKHALEAMAPMAQHGYQIPEQVLDGDRIHAFEPALSDRVEAGFFVESERYVDPHTLVMGLASRLDEMGVAIQEGIRVTGISRVNGRAVAIEANERTWPAGAVILTTGAWCTELLAALGVRIPMLAGKGYSFSIGVGLLPKSPLYLIESKIACTPMGDHLRLAGTMELSGVNNKLSHRRIEAMRWGASNFLRSADWGSRSDDWVGMRPVTADGLPVIDRVPGLDNVYAATGHAMLGITLGPSTGRAVAEMVTGPNRIKTLEPFGFARFES